MIKAVGNQLLIKPIYEDKTEKIIIPDIAKKQSADFYGIVLSIGPDFPHKDEIKVGSKILFTRNEGTEIEDKYIALKPDWVIAVVEQE